MKKKEKQSELVYFEPETNEEISFNISINMFQEYIDNGYTPEYAGFMTSSYLFEFFGNTVQKDNLKHINEHFKKLILNNLELRKINNDKIVENLMNKPIELGFK